MMDAAAEVEDAELDIEETDDAAEDEDADATLLLDAEDGEEASFDPQADSARVAAAARAAQVAVLRCIE
ncbi:hypothetical protein [Nakamurella endophytica]|uniref:hypothetical protein n=1 Tax=Nakamurella endophytica TaxID=1748367 RepID=UPI00166EAE51|nr:hypothetical protein [Nakamurella endophytica]